MATVRYGKYQEHRKLTYTTAKCQIVVPKHIVARQQKARHVIENDAYTGYKRPINYTPSVASSSIGNPHYVQY